MADWRPGADRQQSLQPVGNEQRQQIWTLQSGVEADGSALAPQLHQEAERARDAATELLQEHGRLQAEAVSAA